MKKKLIKSKIAKRSVKKKTSYSRYTFAGFAIVLLLLVGNLAFRPVDRPYVLGTSVLLARGGDDSGSGESGDLNGGSGSSGGSTSTSGSSGGASGGNNSGSGTSSVASTNQGSGNNSNSSGNGAASSSVAGGAFVDCIGPDNKHFQTSFKACSNLNHAFHHDNFSFTPLKPIVNNLQHFDSSDSARQISSRSGIFKDTKSLPPSFDPLKMGVRDDGSENTETQTAKILPDEAVSHILKAGILNSVETDVASDSSSPKPAFKTTLTKLNNEDVFKVHGFSNKKALGIIPVSFAKTVFVSAENGSIVKTDETFFSKLLEAISL